MKITLTSIMVDDQDKALTFSEENQRKWEQILQFFSRIRAATLSISASSTKHGKKEHHE